MYYKYNTSSCVITEKSEAGFDAQTIIPEEFLVVYSNIDFDIDLNEVIVGKVSPEGEIIRYAQFVKPVEELASIIKSTKAELAQTKELLASTTTQLEAVQEGLDFLFMQ